MRRATSPKSLPKTAPIIRFVTYNPRGTGRGMDAAVRKNYNKKFGKTGKDKGY